MLMRVLLVLFQKSIRVGGVASLLDSPITIPSCTAEGFLCFLKPFLAPVYNVIVGTHVGSNLPSAFCMTMDS